ncbi:MAG: hypothetical protein AB1832_01050 [Pseudomonadota bacterium]
MHATATATAPAAPRPSTIRGQIPARSIRPGETFIRPESLNEVLTPLSAGGKDCTEAEHLWAVVIATQAGAHGPVRGELVKIRRDALVVPVPEIRAPAYALER